MIALRWIALGALVAGLTFSHGYAYRHGVAAEAARWAEAREKLQDQVFDLADRHSEAAAELAALRAEQDTLAMEFEDAARADPDASSRRPSADSLRRLETLWRGARPAP